jgi:hypothetical protein
MGALHQLYAGYYVPVAVGILGGTQSGSPGDQWGWAIGAGLKVNMPMIGPGDYWAVQFAYAEGAARYVANTNPNSPQAWGGGAGSSLGYGFTTDAVMATNAAGVTSAFGTKMELTTNWGVAAAYEHFWTPSLRSSLHGSYVRTEYNTRANNIICGAQTTTLAAGSIHFGGATESPVALCNNDWSQWQVGSRSQWNVTKDFYIGVDVVYYKLQTASNGAVVTFTAQGAQPTGLRTITDQDAIAGRFRIHRDIVP